MHVRSRLAAALAVACMAGIAAAQSFPQRPIRVVTPFGPGNAGDIIPRAIAPFMADFLRQNVVMDNRPGAGGNIAAEIVAKAGADGHTLMFVTIGTHGINPSIYPKLPYDPLRDFTPIALCSTSPNMLVVNPSLAAQSVKDLIALARARPGELNFGSSGIGTSVHLSGELFNVLSGVKTVHIAYKGATESLTDLMAGRTQFIFASLSSSIQFVKQARLRALAVTSPKRHPSVPDVPTMIEAGVAGFEATAWFGYVAPAGTPRAIVERLNESIVTGLKTQDLRDKLLAVGVDAAASTPDEFTAFMKAEIAKWARVVKEAGIKVL